MYGLRFAVLADAHIGRSIPLAIAEHRRRAFSRAFTKAVDAIVEAGVDYVFFCGDLFERRTLRPYLVQFAHDELYRLAKETEERHGKRVKILVIRGNHDGRPQSNTLDYIRHPLAEYLVIFGDYDIVFRDRRLHVVGLNYYDELDKAFEAKVKKAFDGAEGTRVLMIHGFVAGYNEVPPYSSSVTLDQLASVDPDFVFAGHHHQRCRPKRLPNGGWVVTPGSLEMYDFAESPEKGFYIDQMGDGEPEFSWVPIEPMHLMRGARVESDRERTPRWYGDRILEQVRAFTEELRKAGKKGYLRVRVKGRLSEGFPSDIDLREVDELKGAEPLLLWVDVDTMALDLPPLMVRPTVDHLDVAEFFKDFGEFAEDIQEMHRNVGETLDGEASLQTGLLTSSRRKPLVEEWVERLEKRRFKGEDA